MAGHIGGWPLWGLLAIALSSGCCCVGGDGMMVGDLAPEGILTGGCTSCAGGYCDQAMAVDPALGDGSFVDGSFGGGAFAGPFWPGPFLGLFGPPLAYSGSMYESEPVGAYGPAAYGGWGGYWWDGCAPCPCGHCGSPYGYGPILGVLGLIRQGLVCGFGCGSIYWDEWISDPPLCHDPCGPMDCVGDCGVGCGCGGNDYLSQRAYNFGHPKADCPDGSCGATHVHSSEHEQILVGSVPTESHSSQRVTQSGPRTVRRGSPHLAETRTVRQVTSQPMTMSTAHPTARSGHVRTARPAAYGGRLR